MERKKEREVVYDASPIHCLSLANSPSGEIVEQKSLLCETYPHLFYYCPRAQVCWSWAKRRWKSSTRRSLSLSLDFALTGGDRFWVFLASATIQAIWKARCQEIFPEPSNPVPALPILQSLLKHQLTTLHHLHKLPSPATKNAALVSVQDKRLFFSF